MSIAVENYYAYSTIGTKSITFAEDYRACVVALALGDTNGKNTTSATCDGSAMTLAESETASYSRTGTYIWYKLNPAIGAKNNVPTSHYN